MSGLASFEIGLATQNFTAGASQIRTDIELIGKSINRLNQHKLTVLDDFVKLGDSIESAEQKLTNLDRAVVTLNKNSAQTATTAQGLLGTNENLLSQLIGPAIEFEHSLLGIRKETGLGAAEAEKFGRQLLTLTRTIPLTSSEFSEIATQGAKLGLATSELTGFSELTGRVATAFNVDATSAAQQIGQLKNIYGLELPALEEEVLDTIAFLEAKGQVAAPELIGFHTRIGSLSKDFGLSVRETSALGASLLAQGIGADQASTALAGLLSTLSNAQSGTTAFKDSLTQLGLSATDLETAVGENASGAIEGVLSKISALPKGEQLGVVKSMFGAGSADHIFSLASNLSLLQGEMEKANDQTQTSGYLNQQFALSLDNTKIQLKLLGNAFAELRIKALLPLLGGLRWLFSEVAGVLNLMSRFADQFPRLTGLLVGFTVGALALSAVSYNLALAWTMLTFGGLKFYGVGKALIGILTKAGVATKLWTAATWLFNAALNANPIVLVVAAVASLIGAGYLLIKHWDKVKQFFIGLWQWFSKFIGKVFGAVTGFLKLKGKFFWWW